MKKTAQRRLYSYTAVLAGLVGLAGTAHSGQQSLRPNGPGTGIVEWAEQGWNASRRDYFHYASQGTVLAPVDWFLALEQPGSGGGLFSAPEYLEAFGFIHESPSPMNRLGLPIGLAVAPSGAPGAGTVGLTCAACHTGELRYQGRKLRIDGGQSMLNTGSFGGALGLAMIQTYLDPGKWARFSGRVLGPDAGAAAQDDLRLKFGGRVAKLQWTAQVTADRGLMVTEEGFGRNDAIGRIGNNTFGNDLHDSGNFHVLSAPVSYPQLWDIWKFDWVQYDASVIQPMARNVGEALGVGALTNFLDAEGNPVPEPAKWSTTINFENLHGIEEVLQGLRPPSWPSALFGRPDRVMAEQGRRLFAENCAGCHAPRPIAPPYNRYAKLAVTTVPLERIGTDPMRVLNSSSAFFDPSKLLGEPSGPIDLNGGLDLVTERIKDLYYDASGFGDRQRAEYDGFGRPNLGRFELLYKARPLDGVWTTAPYLHNGSVRNLYELLSPVGERAKVFAVGSNEYDPVLLGLGEVPAGGFSFQMDVSKPGNGNGGHEFNDGPAPGVIGRKLSHREKMAIIEYIKVLDEMPPGPVRAVPLDWGQYGWNP